MPARKSTAQISESLNMIERSVFKMSVNKDLLSVTYDILSLLDI